MPQLQIRIDTTDLEIVYKLKKKIFEGPERQYNA